MLHKYARAYILYMFGNMLFMNFSKTCVPLFYLPLVEDFDVIPLYNRGPTRSCMFKHESMEYKHEKGKINRRMFAAFTC